MTTRWTPGPWDYRRVLGDKTEWGVFEVGATNDDVSLCVMYEANARLISAAPDMACLLYTSPSPRDVEESRMPSSA